VLDTLAEALRIIALYLFPFMPSTAAKLWEQLNPGADISGTRLDTEGQWGRLQPGTKVVKGPGLFPRIEKK
jgi:methionyl-tRNA synthetase